MSIEHAVGPIGEILEKSKYSDDGDRAFGRALQAAAKGVVIGGALGGPLGSAVGGYAGYMIGMGLDSEEGANDSLLHLRGEMERNGAHFTI
jgi:hypothetical protein